MSHEFTAFAQACGLLVLDTMPDTRIRRCGTIDKPKSKNGSYLWDGKRGWCLAWDKGGDIQFYGNDRQEFTQAEKAEWGKRKREAEKRISRNHETAKLRSDIMLRDAIKKEHGYLMFKGFPEAKGFVDGEGKLLIPMYDAIGGDLRGLQSIVWIPGERRYEKKMIHGMMAKGAVYRIGNPAHETWLCEGYATGLSIAAAIRQLHLQAQVIVCFSDSNLVHVAGRLPGKRMIFADNDKSQAGETAAIKTGLPYCMSATIGEDANDSHLNDGLLAVCKLIMDCRKRAK